MNAKQLLNLGIPRGAPMMAARRLCVDAARRGLSIEHLGASLSAVVENPTAHLDNPPFDELARAILEAVEAGRRFVPREHPAPWKQWGSDIDDGALDQMRNACKLPVAVRGALMPDAHIGYGLPIGGVLATRDAVIPYAVGVDIACRMKLTVLDLPPAMLDEHPDRLAKAIDTETRFGIGAHFKQKRDHSVMEADWTICQTTKTVRDRAWAQLGTSGSGNHFVEFGELTLERAAPELELEPGRYLALLTHGGSRGAGAAVAAEYSRLAMALHPGLPRDLIHLAWLPLSSETGQEYWRAMELMGRYAAANHELIHRHIAAHLGAHVLLDVENHHNFAWRETHGGEDLIVHRKGATPAGKGVLGLIPGSMGAPGFLVRGRGENLSLDSAAHGAGRRMSRTEANRRFNWPDVKRHLEKRRVRLLSAGLDEAPMAYKDIEEVMRAQKDLVEPLARFDPRLVKMASAGERPED